MKIQLIFFFLVITLLANGQEKQLVVPSQPNEKGPTMVIVIDSIQYPIDQTIMKKIDPMWIDQIEVVRSDEAKHIFGNKDGVVFIYPLSKFTDQFLALCGLKEDTLVYTTVDSYPEFVYKHGKTTKESVEYYFRETYTMPEILRDNSYSGHFYLYFIVEKDGTLTQVKMNRGVDPAIDHSVVMHVASMPYWTPAKIGNEAVRYRYLLGVDIQWLSGLQK